MVKMREIWDEVYRGVRKGARGIAEEEFKKYPEAQTIMIPYIMPIEPLPPLDRYAIEPLGNCEYNEIIFDEYGKQIRKRHSSQWIQFLEIKRQKKDG